MSQVFPGSEAPDVLAADFLIVRPDWVISPGWIAIVDGCVAEIGSGGPPREACTVRGGRNSILLPGLVNAHAHLALGSLAGLAPDREFLPWITEGIQPTVLAHWDDEEFFAEGAYRSVRQLVAGGVTAIGDAFFSATGAAAMVRIGLRGVFFQEVFGSLAADEDAYQHEVATLAARLPASFGSRVASGWSPHTPWTCPRRTLQGVVRRARAAGQRSSIHVAESLDEHAFFKDAAGPLKEGLARRGVLDRYEFGRTPIAYLESLNGLGPDILAVHCVQATDDDVAILARTGTPVVHCPTSNMRLAEGIAPIRALLEAGVSVALGTDSAASADRLDLFAEMRQVLLTQRAVHRAVGPFSAATVLHMATCAGALALGLPGNGTLEVGQPADAVLLELDGPIPDPVVAVVHRAGPEFVTKVFVDGRLLHPRAEGSGS